MAKYDVSMTTCAYAIVTVEADNEDDAMERALEEGPTSICAQCSGWGANWSLDLGGWDIADDYPDDPAVRLIG